MSEITEEDIYDLFEVEYNPPPNRLKKQREKSQEFRQQRSKVVNEYIKCLIKGGLPRKIILEQEYIYIYEKNGKEIKERIKLTAERYKKAKNEIEKEERKAE